MSRLTVIHLVFSSRGQVIGTQKPGWFATVVEDAGIAVRHSFAIKISVGSKREFWHVVAL